MGKAGRGFSGSARQIASLRGGRRLSAGLERIAQRAKENRQERFTALAHHLTEDFLKETFHQMNQHGAPGVDRVSMAEYGQDLDANVADLVERMKRRAYDAPNVRRTYIEKRGNPSKLRPLGIPVVEDRLLQAAVARILGAIYEPIFRNGSFGFRPGRSAHGALRAVRETVESGEAQWVYEADIKGFFDHIGHAWLMTMLELKIGDQWILRLIRKWLGAGIFENGTVHHPEQGTPQGGPISPIIANVYLHYVLDLWFDREFRLGCQGHARIVRYADDFIVLFEDEADATRFAAALPERLAKFGLEVAPEKTRLVPFGRQHWRQGEGVAGSFDFLGFSHYLGATRKGRMVVVRLPAKKGVHRFLMEVKAWLRRNMHLPPREQQRALAAKLRGYFQYFGLSRTVRVLNKVRYQLLWYWARTLRRRSQRDRTTLASLWQRAWFTLPEARVIHPEV